MDDNEAMTDKLARKRLPPEDMLPRSLKRFDAWMNRSVAEVARHMLPLHKYVGELQKKPGVIVPRFDPLDGGVEAEILFLFEKPGPKTAVVEYPEIGRRIGFISRNNDDPTAEATHFFMEQAEISREKTITWNVMPWWNGTTKLTSDEIKEGVAALEGLIDLLPNLKVVVFVGRKAERARPLLRDRGLKTFVSAHPSPKVKATNRAKWDEIAVIWKQAARSIE